MRLTKGVMLKNSLQRIWENKLGFYFGIVEFWFLIFWDFFGIWMKINEYDDENEDEDKEKEEDENR